MAIPLRRRYSLCPSEPREHQIQLPRWHGRDRVAAAVQRLLAAQVPAEGAMEFDGRVVNAFGISLMAENCMAVDYDDLFAAAPAGDESRLIHEGFAGCSDESARRAGGNLGRGPLA